MRTDIKAIETIYKGYRFRSRLEARWGVFFDVAGLRWEYEPEGFELPSSVRYLPDFRLTSSHRKVWVEVKAEMPTARELLKLQSLLDPKNSADFGLFLVGQPCDHTNVKIVYSQSFGLDVRTIPYEDARVTLDWLGSEEHISTRGDTWARAVAAARSARFEFGEQGACA